MNVSDVFPSKYLKAADLGDRGYAVTMREIRFEEMRNYKGQLVKNPVLYFQNAEKGLVLSSYNGHKIGDLHGEKMDDWPGKRIYLYVEKGLLVGGKKRNPVRVSDDIPPPNGKEQTQTIPAEEESYDEEFDETDLGFAQETPAAPPPDDPLEPYRDACRQLIVALPEAEHPDLLKTLGTLDKVHELEGFQHHLTRRIREGIAAQDPAHERSSA